ncbi:MAG: glycosyltransferase family 2 protein [Chloroflexi bacterium]|jgi:polyisoprenyl-phosphate glycosyltransferase|nr:glycosyltransferase family 2 protein [Chloroflexota bacterium]MBT3670664.1 glycosyltransferase family 2 protein [Chloroflexota bacterium]MBT4002677.1 glycosyltransferase family 2 protein [Chloroflexota bacterium]MBT4306300.1 glycosyltransferase family 2 protein [Chloroflexota bacterium]MBT4532819.1 glycosyltransferase family 2 protein [Chloroflexota bacterium]
MKKSIEISVVVPMFNEKDTIMELYSQISEVMEKTKKSWEFVIVDDGSTDQTPEMIRELAKKDDRVRPVIFARNFGQQAAVKAGLDYSRGEGVVVIDADLQDPPEVILELIEKWEEGYEVIYAQRTEREGESFLKLLTAKMFYATIQRLTDINMPMNTGFFRLLDRKVVDVINQLPEKNRFFRGLSIWVGFKQIAVPYKRKARFAGETKYPFSKMFKLAITAITGFSFFPLQVAMYLGFISSGIAIITIPVVIIMRMLGNQAFLGQASTLIAVLFLGGVQLVSLGIIGEYIGRLYDEVRGRPMYIVREAPDMDE